MFERLPDESVLCFCLENFISKQITKEELLVLWKRVEVISKQKNFPSYRERHPITIITNTDINKILQDIAKNMQTDIENNTSKMSLTHVFMLKITPELSVQRVMLRNRDGEDHYTAEYIARICKIYDRLIAILSDEHKSPIVDPWVLIE